MSLYSLHFLFRIPSLTPTTAHFSGADWINLQNFKSSFLSSGDAPISTMCIAVYCCMNGRINPLYLLDHFIFNHIHAPITIFLRLFSYETYCIELGETLFPSTSKKKSHLHQKSWQICYSWPEELFHPKERWYSLFFFYL